MRLSIEHSLLSDLKYAVIRDVVRAFFPFAMCRLPLL
jgi:hypothetical protein